MKHRTARTEVIEASVTANGGGKMAGCGRAVVGGTGAAEARGLCGKSAMCGEIVVTIYGRFAPSSLWPMSRNTAPRTPRVRVSVTFLTFCAY